MQADVVQEVLKRIDLLGDKVSSGAGQYLELATQSMYLRGVVGVVIGLILATIGIIGMIRARKRFIQLEKNSGGSDGGMFEPFIGAMCIIVVLIGVVMICSLLLHIFTPEYYAVKEIVQIVMPK